MKRRQPRLRELPPVMPMLSRPIESKFIVKIYVTERRRRPWVFDVELTGSLYGYGEGSTWRHPKPCQVRGRARTETEAIALAHGVVEDAKYRMRRARADRARVEAGTYTEAVKL